jgi:hypothetical protein
MTKEMKDRMMYALGVIIIFGFFASLAFLFLVPIDATNKDALMLGLGSLNTFAGGVVGYFYGSSKGSADKTDIMSGKTE